MGFMVIERLAERWRIPLCVNGGVRIGRGRFRDVPVILIEPQRYMNLSGETLVDALPELDHGQDGTSLAKPRTAEIVVVHDDLDLARGQLRVKRGGGAGGHRGVASIAARSGADFLRIRLGVGRPPEGEDAAEYVLAPLSDEEREELAATIERAAEAVESLVSSGLEATRNRFNQRVTKPAGIN